MMMINIRTTTILSSSSCASMIGIALFHFCILVMISTQTAFIISTNASLDIRGGIIVGNNSIYNHYEEEDAQDHHQYHHHEPHYTQQWAVHIPGGHHVANDLASKHGFENTGQILPDYYHFVHRKVAKRSTEPCHEYHQALSAEPEIHWHAQQTVKRRTKRDFLPNSGPNSRVSNSNAYGTRRSLKTRSNLVIFNDPRWPAMWYLNRGAGLDMNVQEAWADGITGKGIVVTILDDGLEKDHPDIQHNYDPLASFDVNSLDNDPMPTYDFTDSNRHGTRCAGEVAAEANNSLCAVGVAYEASVGGVRMLDGDVTDAVEARSLSHNPQHIDIYSASWGPDDDGKTVDGPGELATRAFMEGITKGRQGKGSIFVWASGNGGRDHDNCNCDGYTNSIWTLSISSATENGLVPWYSEACSSTLATTYSSGGTGEKQIVTIDLHHACTSSHTGTSASAPLAAGICALALQANTNLTWRDMQHIVVQTARPANLIAPDWATNGVGRNVSHSFGYGLMDAGAMVKLAKQWKTVPEQNKCEVKAPYSDKNIPAKSKVTLDLKVTECLGVNILEHVQAKVTLTSGRRGDLQIFLVSPSGTRSTLLAHRRHDLNRSGFTDWPFMTVHNWGESPLGKWTLEIHNEGRYTDHKNGKLQSWTLISHGITSNPNDEIATPVPHKPDFLSNGPGNANNEYDGSENKIVPGPSQIQQSNKPVAVPSLPELTNSNDDLSSTHLSANSAATSLHIPGCIRISSLSSGQCLECQSHLFLRDGMCASSCPLNNFLETDYSTGARQCVPCHHSCRTCYDRNDSQCLSCYSDSTLRTTIRTVFTPIDPENNDSSSGQNIQTTYKESHCYPTSLLDAIDGNELWYKALLLGVIVNVTIIVLLLFYVWVQRQRDRANGSSSLNTRNSNENDDEDSTGEDDLGLEDDESGDNNGGVNSWLTAKKAYSLVSPHDDEDDKVNVIIAQNSSNKKEIQEQNQQDRNDVKITIPSIKRSLAQEKSIRNNYLNNNYSSHSKLKANAQKSRKPPAIPLANLKFIPNLHSNS